MKFTLTRVELKETNKHLSRIAAALERLLVEAYGIAPAPTVAADPAEPEDVSYRSDLDVLKEEVDEAIHGRVVTEEE